MDILLKLAVYCIIDWIKNQLYNKFGSW